MATMKTPPGHYMRLNALGEPEYVKLTREKTPEERIAGLEEELNRANANAIYCVDDGVIPVYVSGKDVPEHATLATAAEINALVRMLEAFRATSLAGKPDDGSITRFTSLCKTDKTMYALDTHGLTWYIDLTTGAWQRHWNPGEKQA